MAIMDGRSSAPMWHEGLEGGFGAIAGFDSNLNEFQGA
jgi:hypothetical protein